MNTDSGRSGFRGALTRVRAGLRDDPGPAATALRRSVRVTLAAALAFYLCLYGLHQPVTATYALFGAVSMAGLSRIPGTGRQRAAVLLRVLPVGWVLLTVGTLLAVRTWAAVAGMLVIGFALAFGAVAGPRIAGATPGLQLLYILPCFPPYAPGTLGERLGGMTFGIALLIAAEAALLPDPPTRSYRELTAEAARTAARCARQLTGPPWDLTGESRQQTHVASQALRLSQVPEADRPGGAGRRARALAQAGATARVLLARLRDLAPAADRDRESGPGQAVLDLLREITRAAEQAAATLGGAPPADPRPLRQVLTAFHDGRATAIARGHVTGATMRCQAALVETGEAALTLLVTADLAAGARQPVPPSLRSALWYAELSGVQLWRHRLTGHLSIRSVYFQNAIRLSLGLAAARAVAGVLSLPHGFWAMLAALTLTRTTTGQTGTTIRQALTGTMLGALAAAGLLVAAGHHTNVYAVALPVVMFATFRFGPVRGVGWAQGLFTLTVATVFAQLAPAGWHLAEARLLDVVTGSLIGLVIGLLAWPKGAHDELRRDIADLLRAIATTVTATVRQLAGGTGPAPARSTIPHALSLAESSYAQFQCEPRGPARDAPDWQAALIAGHHALRGSRRLFDERPSPAPQAPQSPQSPQDRQAGPAAGINGYADVLAGQYRLLAEQLDAGTAPRAPLGAPTWTPPAPEGQDATAASAMLLLFDAGAWLQGLSADLARITARHPGQPDGDGRFGPAAR